MPYGIRAACIILRKYIRKYGCNTIKSIISKWAPANENNTTAYIDRVSKAMHQSSNDAIDYQNEAMMCELIHAMAVVENGGDYVDKNTILLGYRLAGK